MDPVRMYDYLAASRGKVLKAARELTPQEWAHDHGIGLKTIGSTVTHIMISEWYYWQRLEGHEVPHYAAWPIQYERPPSFGVVEHTWGEQAPRVRAAIAAEQDWQRTITYHSQADEQGRRWRVTMTAADLVSQLVLHEVHHRSQAMSMLRRARGGVLAVQDIDYGDLMYRREPLG